MPPTDAHRISPIRGYSSVGGAALAGVALYTALETMFRHADGRILFGKQRKTASTCTVYTNGNATAAVGRGGKSLMTTDSGQLTSEARVSD